MIVENINPWVEGLLMFGSMVCRAAMKYVAVVSVLALLSACGGGGGSDAPPADSNTDDTNAPPRPNLIGVTLDETRLAAQNALHAIISEPIATLQAMYDASSADNILVHTIATPTSLWRALPTWDAPGGDRSVLLSTGVTWRESALRVLLGTSSRSDNTITYTPDPVDVCANENAVSALRSLLVFGSASANDVQSWCPAVVAHLTVVQTVTSKTAGTLVFHYDAHTPFSVSYAERAYALDVDWSAIAATAKDAAILLAKDTHANFVDMSGAFHYERNDSADGAMELTLGVPEQVVIDGWGTTAHFDLRIAAGTNVLTKQVDAAQKNLHVTVSLGDFQYGGTRTIGAGEIHHVVEETDGLSGELMLDTAADTMTVTGFELAKGAQRLRVDDAVAMTRASKALDVKTSGGALATMDINAEATIEFELTNVAHWLSTNDPVDSVATSTTTVPAATRIEVYGNVNGAPSTINKIAAGGLTVASSGWLNVNSAVAVDQCYRLVIGSLPLADIADTCPANAAALSLTVAQWSAPDTADMVQVTYVGQAVGNTTGSSFASETFSNVTPGAANGTSTRYPNLNTATPTYWTATPGTTSPGSLIGTDYSTF